MRQGLRSHPKFLRLVSMLRMPEAHVLGHLTLLWETSYEIGEVVGDQTDVELTAGWVGVPGLLCDALLGCGGAGRSGFIEAVPETPGVYRIHDLFDHAPQYVQRRMEREFKRQARGQTISDIRRAAVQARYSKQLQTTSQLNPEDYKQLQMANTCIQVTTNDSTPSPSPIYIPTVCETTKVASPRKPRKAKVEKPAEPSLEEILGGKDSKTWERYWRLAALWLQEKNPKPKDTARALLEAFAKDEPKTIYKGALAFSEPFQPVNGHQPDRRQFMPQLAAWLRGEGWKVALNQQPNPLEESHA